MEVVADSKDRDVRKINEVRQADFIHHDAADFNRARASKLIIHGLPDHDLFEVRVGSDE